MLFFDEFAYYLLCVSDIFFLSLQIIVWSQTTGDRRLVLDVFSPWKYKYFQGIIMDTGDLNNELALVESSYHYLYHWGQPFGQACRRVSPTPFLNGTPVSFLSLIYCFVVFSLYCAPAWPTALVSAPCSIWCCVPGYLPNLSSSTHRGSNTWRLPVPEVGNPWFAW